MNPNRPILVGTGKVPGLQTTGLRVVLAGLLALLAGCAGQPTNESPVAAAPRQRIFRVVSHPEPESPPMELEPAPAPTAAAKTDVLADSAALQMGPPAPSDLESGASAKPRPAKPGKFRSRSKTSKHRGTETIGAPRVASSDAAKIKSHRPRRGDPGWHQFRDRSVLAAVQHERVDAVIAEFKSKPGTFEFLTKRAEPFLPYLMAEIERRHLPPDLVLVPMVESAFDPSAVSGKQAAGLWQFMPSTGLQYGLSQADGYDGRFDIHAATGAAFAHFKHLLSVFKNDWLLALAAYNVGEGGVQRAIEANAKANLGTTFWDLNLPAETRAYVPKIVALARILAEPEANGFRPRPVKSAATLARIEFAPEIKMTDVIAASGMSQEDMLKLNPAFKPEAVLPAGKRYSLLLPYDRAENLANNLAGTKFLAARWIVVKKGDTLSVLAKRHGVPETKLVEWNGLKPRQRLKEGQELVVLPV